MEKINTEISSELAPLDVGQLQTNCLEVSDKSYLKKCKGVKKMFFSISEFLDFSDEEILNIFLDENQNLSKENGF